METKGEEKRRFSLELLKVAEEEKPEPIFVPKEKEVKEELKESSKELEEKKKIPKEDEDDLTKEIL